MPLLVIMGVLFLAFWLGYEVSPIPKCRRIARILDEGADAFFGAGPRWDMFDIIDCTFASKEQRNKWEAVAVSLRFNATMLNQTMSDGRR
jgi:hypothetical protein